MDPADFKELAVELANTNSPAKIRTAVSRAYYAAYHTGFKVLKDMGFPIKEGAAGHGEVQGCLANSGDQEIEKAGSKLGDLHTKRIRADYRLDKKDTENPKTAKALIQNSEEIMLTLGICAFDKSKRSQIIKVIKKWWVDVYCGIYKETK